MTHPNADRAASRQLADALRAQIENGAYPPGSKVPSYRQLRDSHHVALNTAQAAVRMLAADGLVEIRPARGAYVRDNPDDPIGVRFPSTARVWNYQLGGKDLYQLGGPDLTLRAELTDLQAILQRTKQDLAAAETAIANLLARLAAEEQAP